MYIGNVQLVTIINPKMFAKIPPKYAEAVSVSGYFQDFIIVGTAAKASLNMANNIATEKL